MQIKIINTSDNPTPEYKSKNAAGFDIQAQIRNEHDRIVIEPYTQKLIGTGLSFEIPEGYYLQLKSRSGLAAKQNLHVGAGVIDSDYRGEVHILLINQGEAAQTIRHGDRIAQGIIIPYIQANFQTVQKLSDTMRGDGGFGSTGVANEVSKAVVKETPQVVVLSELEVGDSVEFRNGLVRKVIDFGTHKNDEFYPFWVGLQVLEGDDICLSNKPDYADNGKYWADSRKSDFDIVRIIKA